MVVLLLTLALLAALVVVVGRWFTARVGRAAASHRLRQGAVVLSAAASVFLGLTLTADEGATVVLVILVPVAVSLVGLWATGLPEPVGPVLGWVSAFAMLGFVILGVLSIGLFYLPAALLLFAGVTAERGTGWPD